ncbi:hypothetical protein ACTWJ9_06305 [Streptomyces sp. GDS52]|uniref:Uncharacterized protein n=1 Tax=Streptomyces cathayae TaxID=3031124 RepID=A0ABY8JZU1_9ACTN|nr:hypothetical protein [Streptomyces sp. HUAS 5]WGD40191.1 hypothetical protein PYS65_08645 [Streptomyces sp. HUAS 5]
MATRRPTPKLQEATDARDALAAALTQAGIQLPAMDVRTPWGDVLPDDMEERTADAAEGLRTPASARYALVHLGVCSAPVALALAAVIARGAAR